jgi:hypothetical protein
MGRQCDGLTPVGLQNALRDIEDVLGLVRENNWDFN